MNAEQALEVSNKVRLERTNKLVDACYCACLIAVRDAAAVGDYSVPRGRGVASCIPLYGLLTLSQSDDLNHKLRELGYKVFPNKDYDEEGAASSTISWAPEPPAKEAVAAPAKTFWSSLRALFI